jgi:rare lipoprotein A
LTYCAIGVAGRRVQQNERKYVLRNQNTTHCRSIKAAALTAALTCVFATGAQVTPSLARPHSANEVFARATKADFRSALSGVASVYHDRMTASGEHMNPNAMTAAHKTLPLGSIVTVRNHRNGRTLTVRINDRGPYVHGRVIDLSPGAARVLGVDGLAPVSLRVAGRAGRRV